MKSVTEDYEPIGYSLATYQRMCHIWQHASLLYHNLGWEEAILQFGFAAADVPDSAIKSRLYLNMAIIALHLGDYAQAAKTIMVAVQLQPEDLLSYFLLGIAMYEQELHFAARMAFWICASLFPTSQSWVEYGELGLKFTLHVAMVSENFRAASLEDGHDVIPFWTREVRRYVLHRLPAGLIFEPPSRKSARSPLSTNLLRNDFTVDVKTGGKTPVSSPSLPGGESGLCGECATPYIEQRPKDVAAQFAKLGSEHCTAMFSNQDSSLRSMHRIRSSVTAVRPRFSGRTLQRLFKLRKSDKPHLDDCHGVKFGPGIYNAESGTGHEIGPENKRMKLPRDPQLGRENLRELALFIKETGPGHNAEATNPIVTDCGLDRGFVVQRPLRPATQTLATVSADAFAAPVWRPPDHLRLGAASTAQDASAASAVVYSTSESTYSSSTSVVIDAIGIDPAAIEVLPSMTYQPPKREADRKHTIWKSNARDGVPNDESVDSPAAAYEGQRKHGLEAYEKMLDYGHPRRKIDPVLSALSKLHTPGSSASSVVRGMTDSQRVSFVLSETLTTLESSDRDVETFTHSRAARRITERNLASKAMRNATHQRRAESEEGKLPSLCQKQPSSDSRNNPLPEIEESMEHRRLGTLPVRSDSLQPISPIQCEAMLNRNYPQRRM